MIETFYKWASLGLNQGPPDYESVIFHLLKGYISHIYFISH